MDSMQQADPASFEALIAGVDSFNEDLKNAGAFVHAGGLMPPSTAITVDGTGAGEARARAPFVDAAAYVGGFWILEVGDEEEAVRWAERASSVLQSRIEVRALQG